MSSRRVLTSVFALTCILAFLLIFWIQATSKLPLPPPPLGARPVEHSSSVQSPVPPPSASTWKDWFDPAAAEWNILYHLGGNGPWIRRVDRVVDGASGTPNGCEVRQVHMMSRHAERYPTSKAGIRMLDLLERIRTSNITLKGALGFLSDWKYFASDPQAEFEQLTSTGPYAGTLEAFATGVKLRTRYGHLLPYRYPPGGGKTSLWASDSGRVVDTARYFSAGFFGLNWKDTAELHVIPETAERGGDTLTPGDSCIAYLEDEENGHEQGNSKLIEYRNTYLPAIADRLEKQLLDTAVNISLRFTDDEVYAMQEMCGFELTVRGSSPWCDVFTNDEWRSFEFARDVTHFYRGGPGNKYAASMGSLWLNATALLLVEGPSAGPFFFSFVHDGDIAPMLASLDLFPEPELLPVTGHIPSARAWRMSQTLPMGGRIIFEQMHCRQTTEPYIRVNVNDGIVAIPGCNSGPGSSCPLIDFLDLIGRRRSEGGDFRETCGLGPDVPDRITFLHQ